MSLMLGNLTLGLSPWTLLVPIVATGFALSFVFVPITTQAYSTLRNDQIGNASGIFNLLRNVGGSIGISIAQTLLVRRSAAHQVQIGGSVSTTQYWFEQQISGLTGYLSRHTAAPNAAACGAGTAVSTAGAAVFAVGVCGCVPVDEPDLFCLCDFGLVFPEGEAWGEGARGGALRFRLRRWQEKRRSGFSVEWGMVRGWAPGFPKWNQGNTCG
jgi:hypothetical protein